MVQKYQNEISPIVYYGKKLKTSGKLLKIPDLQPRDWGQPYWMTRYIIYSTISDLDIVECVSVLCPGLADGVARLEVGEGAADDDEEVGRGGGGGGVADRGRGEQRGHGQRRDEVPRSTGLVGRPHVRQGACNTSCFTI